MGALKQKMEIIRKMIETKENQDYQDQLLMCFLQDVEEAINERDREIAEAQKLLDGYAEICAGYGEIMEKLFSRDDSEL